MRSFSSDDPDDSSSNNNNNNNNESWQSLKNRAKLRYEASDYHAALQLYRRCLLDEHLTSNPTERSLILSNMVACRLKLGGPANAAAAIQDAKQCVQLNPTWAKAYLRLATAFLAVEEDRDSNAACNALQTCLRLDPGCQEARRLLVRELSRARDRGDRGSSSHHNSNNVEDDSHSHAASPPPPHNPDYQPQREQSQQREREPFLDIDDDLPWTQRIQLACTRYYTQTIVWYTRQNETTQSLCKIGILLIVLYVAFGGRFGLEYLFGTSNNNTRPRYGHYRDTEDGPYQQYRRRQQQAEYRASSSSSGYPRYDADDDDDDYVSNTYGGTGRTNTYSNTNRHYSYGYSGSSLTSWVLGAIMTYSVYRWYGLFPALMMLFQRQRRRHYGGWNMYGAGPMFGRRPGHPHHRHHPGRWW